MNLSLVRRNAAALTLALAACGADQIVQHQQSVYGLSLSFAAAAQLAADCEKNPVTDPAMVAKL